MGRGDRQRDELARWPPVSWKRSGDTWRLDGEPVIVYSLLSPPSRATANLLHDLYRLDSVMTVSLEWRPWDLDAARRNIRGGAAALFQ